MSVNRFTRVCVACEVELRPKQNGVILVEAAVYGFEAIYSADIHECPACGHETIIGVGENALYRRHEGDIAAEVRRREARGERVVLCWLNSREKEAFMRQGAGPELDS